jgi:probable phosphoglycerate mutase
MNVYVVRHGETIINVQNQINGHNGIDLTEDGIRQAEATAESLKNTKIDIIFCSPLCRTKHTARIINKNNVNIIYDDRLIERNSNSMQYLPVSILDDKIWYSLEDTITYSDSESFNSVLDRITSFLNEIKEKCRYKNILLVTHGDVCKAIKLYFSGINNSSIDKFNQKNCEVVKYTL